MKLFKTLFTAGLGTVMLFSVTNQGFSMPYGMGKSMNKGMGMGMNYDCPISEKKREILSKQLELTDEQTKKLESIMEETQDKSKNNYFDIAEKNLELQRELSENEINFEKVKKLIDELAILKAEKMKSKIDSYIKIKDILDKTQLEKFKKLRKRFLNFSMNKGYGRENSMRKKSKKDFRKNNKRDYRGRRNERDDKDDYMRKYKKNYRQNWE